MTLRIPDRGVLCRPVLAVVLTALLGAGAPSALAQTRANVTKPDQAPTDDARAGAAGSARSRPALQSPALQSSARTAVSADDGTPVGDDAPDASRITDIRGTAPARPPVVPGDPVTADDADVDPDVADGAQRLAARQPLDGVLATTEAPAPRDGDVPVEQVQVPVDGELELAEEMSLDDSNLEEAQRLSELPGRPITQRRFGPYQPVGIRVGSFILFPMAEAGLNGTDNVFRSATGRKNDLFTNITAAATLTSNWNRHALEIHVENPRTYHGRFASENDNGLSAQVRGRLDISRRTNIAADLAYTYGQEQRSGINTPTSAVGERPTVITQRAGVELNHRVNRLTLQARGAVTDSRFGTVPTTDPVTGAVTTPDSTGNERNVKQTEIGGRAGWQFSPNLTLYADSVLNGRRHDAPGLADGILRDSEGSRNRVGIAVVYHGKLQGEVSIGTGSQTPSDPRLKPVSGTLYDAKLNWQPTGLTEVVATATSDIGDTVRVGSGGAVTRVFGVEVRHALRRHLILLAGASYSIANVGGTPQRESSTVERLGLEYYLSREMALLAGYQHTQFEGNGTTRGYEDNTVRVGLRVRR